MNRLFLYELLLWSPSCLDGDLHLLKVGTLFAHLPESVRYDDTKSFSPLLEFSVLATNVASKVSYPILVSRTGAAR